MEILHTVGRFDVNTCLKSIVLEPDIHIKESYMFPRENPCDLDEKMQLRFCRNVSRDSCPWVKIKKISSI